MTLRRFFVQKFTYALILYIGMKVSIILFLLNFLLPAMKFIYFKLLFFILTILQSLITSIFISLYHLLLSLFLNLSFQACCSVKIFYDIYRKSLQNVLVLQ